MSSKTLSSETLAASTTPNSAAGARNATEVFAVHGADPEVLAFAMAKYSRSALSMRESLREISAQKAEQFLNTFYFQYGHRSIADLAHIAFAVERLSLMAAIVLADEQRWDGQERSTRYQNFQASGWYAPDFGEDSASAALYAGTIERLQGAYERTTTAVLEVLRARVARPEAMKPEAYVRTLKARAFDVARYLLPLATNTSLGQIVSARTLETQVSRLLSHPAAEVRDLGARLREAATGPAWNVNAEAARAFVEKLAGWQRRAVTENQAERAAASEDGSQSASDELPALAAEADRLFAREVRTAPTLVKYAQPNEYEIETRKDLAAAADELLGNLPIAASPLVDLVERTESLEVEIAATLLYSASHHPYRQIRDFVAGLSAARVHEIADLGLRRRGSHDEALRAYHAGAALRFDLLIDIGAFRDFHRHRRCTQIIQGFTTLHGYERPGSGDLPAGSDGKFDILAEAGVLADFCSAIEDAHRAARQIALGSAPSPGLEAGQPASEAGHSASEAGQSALYLLPLATRMRSLFKMDFAEAQYIAELRSAPAGHFSYRRVAWEMFLAFERQHPSLAKHIRVTDFTQPIDMLKR